MVRKSQLILLSVLGKASRFLVWARINRIPGTKAVYYFLYELIWKWPAKNVVEIAGSKMYLNPRAEGPMRTAYRDYIASGKEKLTTQMFQQTIKEGYTAVDVGANLGYFSLLSARLVGRKGRVYAFEPEPNNYAAMVKNVQLNGYENVIAEQKAVSNTARTVKLYLSNKDVGAHTLREQHNHSQFESNQFGDFVEVEAVTLDDYFKDNQEINVIKMDCEGSEAAVISGADRIIKANKGLKIFTEFYPAAIREMGYSPEQFLQTFREKYGFTITAIDEIYKPTNHSFEVKDIGAFLGLFEDKDKKMNLFLARGGEETK